MKHTLFVAEDDFGSLDFEQTLEAIVANEHAAIEVVQVGSGKTTTIEGNEGAQLGRSDGDNLHDHPLGLVAILRGTERLYDLEALEGIVLLGYRTIAVGAVAELIGEAVEVDALQKVENRLCTHFCDELIGVAVLKILIFARELSQSIEILVFGQQIVDCEIICKSTRLYDNITFVVDDLIELLGGDTEKVAHLVGKRTEIPDVCYRHDQLDVSSTLTTHLFLGHFHTTTVAHDAFVADALILSAVALIVLGRTEDAFAEKSIALGLVGAIVDGFGFQYFAIGVLLNFFRRSQAYGNLGEVSFYLSVCLESHN